MIGLPVHRRAVRLRPVRPPGRPADSSASLAARRALLQAASLYEQATDLRRKVPIDPRPGVVPG